MAARAPASKDGSTGGDGPECRRRLWPLISLLALAFFLLGMLAHTVVAGRGQDRTAAAPGPGRPVERALPDSGRTLIADYEPVEAIMVCSMVGENLESHMLANIVKALHRKVRVIILINSPDEIAPCRRLLSAAGIRPGSVDLLQCNANSPWLRDYGPVFVREANGGVLALESSYLRSGAPGRAVDNDDFAIAMANLLELEIDSLPIRLDGGNIVSNGRDLLCTTTRVLEENRSRGFDGPGLSRLFKRKFGPLKWIMTPALDGEPTGHADIFLTFLGPDTLVVGRMDPDAEPTNAARLDRLAATLREYTAGRLKVFRVPLTRQGEVWRSYCNVVVVNDTILVPSFADSPGEIEAEVMSVYRKAAPHCEVVAIPCDSLLGYDGLLHCMTLTIPRGTALDALKPVLVPCP